MDKTIIPGLLQNTAILLAFSMIYDFTWLRSEGSRSTTRKILTGVFIGITGVIVMITPWKQVPGLVFDTRSVLLSLSGLFMGLIPTLIAAAFTIIYRIILGGPGIWMGIAVIIVSSSIGLLWRKFRPQWRRKNYIRELILVGYAVHIAMFACTLLIPFDLIINTIKNLVFPLLVIYPGATVLLGILMNRQLINSENSNAAVKLAETKRMFFEILQNTTLYSVVLDKNGMMVSCNEPFLKITGYRREEFSNKNVFELLFTLDLSDLARDVFSMIMEGNAPSSSYETEIISREGEKIQVSWNFTPLKDESGRVNGLACIGENITERKKAEAELVNAKARAEESDRLKSIFLANMSHEIRTPMNAIMGFSNLLSEKGISEPERDNYVEIIKNSGERLLSIINDIIDVSKIEAGQLNFNPKECSLNTIFRQSYDLFSESELIKRKPDINFVFDNNADTDDIQLFTDQNRVQQVIDNLLSNAIKFTEKGEVRFGYSLITDENKKFIKVYVSDTGIGIPEDKVDLVFERFRQIDENRFHEGTGLGLSISKGIISLLGGRLWFQSEPGKGTTFWFTLPLVLPERTETRVIDVAKAPPDLSGKTILITEDDYNSFYYLRLIIEGLKANTLHAENGLEALNLVRKRVPDLILLDINMPVMSGFEFLKELKKNGIKTRIVAQTAYAMPEERQRCLEEGCDAYIAKPVRKHELIAAIQTVFS